MSTEHFKNQKNSKVAMNSLLGPLHLFSWAIAKRSILCGRAIVYFPKYELTHDQPTQEPTHKLSLKDAQKSFKKKISKPWLYY